MKRNGRPSIHATLLGCVLAACTAALASYAWLWSPGPQVIHTEPSAFGSVLVVEAHGQRCLDFNEVEDNGQQSCFDLNAPDKMVFSYTRMMTTALFVKPNPANILVIGLGGGTLPMALQKILPHAVIDTVELDPAVARVAERYFGYRKGPRQRLFVDDGRAFIERAQREGAQYDMVMLDAFDNDYIPPHLMTQEFLLAVRSILSKDGVLVANTFTNSHMYDRESATYAAVFGHFFNLRDGNRVLIASRRTLPDDETLLANARALADTLSTFGVDAEHELQKFSRRRDWNSGATVLID